MISILLLLTLSILASCSNAQQLPVFNDLDSAIKMLSKAVSADPSQNHLIAIINGNVSAISDFKIIGSTMSWKQHKIAKQEKIRGEWRPASCVFVNEFCTHPMTITSSPKFNSMGKYDSGFNVELGIESALQQGFPIARTPSSESSARVTHVVPENNYGQIWQQPINIRQVQQSSNCERPGPAADIKCGTWGDETRGNTPISGGGIFGWRTIYAKLDLESCGEV